MKNSHFAYIVLFKKLRVLLHLSQFFDENSYFYFFIDAWLFMKPGKLNKRSSSYIKKPLKILILKKDAVAE